MEKLKLNETPVRTSRNFNINNVKLENIIFPKNVKEFSNLNIIGKAQISSNVDNINLTYGLGEPALKHVEENTNKVLKIIPENNVEIEFKLNSENANLIENIEIIAKENTKSQVLIKYSSEDEKEYFHNGVIRLLAEKDSNIDIKVINLINTKSNNFLSIQNDIYQNANVNYTVIDFGGKNSITNYYSNLNGDFSENKIESIYLGKEEQLFDLNYIAELKGVETKINIDVVGALKDNARKHFKGTIDFKKGCKKAVGDENEECMLLSNTAKSVALPMLLCSEEDVEGNHASSAGKIGEKELFYIMSRGFELKEAMKLMIRAKFNKILDNIKDENLRREIEEEIDKRLD